MGRTKNAVPTYLLHQHTGQARIRVDGREYLLPGPYGSDESRIAYGLLISRIASGLPIIDTMAKTKLTVASKHPGPTVSEICLAFWNHAQKHYVKNGKQTSEVHCYRSCLKILREL